MFNIMHLYTVRANSFLTLAYRSYRIYLGKPVQFVDIPQPLVTPQPQANFGNVFVLCCNRLVTAHRMGVTVNFLTH